MDIIEGQLELYSCIMVRRLNESNSFLNDDGLYEISDEGFQFIKIDGHDPGWTTC